VLLILGSLRHGAVAVVGGQVGAGAVAAVTAMALRLSGIAIG
jgi:hypothetical protein